MKTHPWSDKAKTPENSCNERCGSLFKDKKKLLYKTNDKPIKYFILFVNNMLNYHINNFKFDIFFKIIKNIFTMLYNIIHGNISLCVIFLKRLLIQLNFKG